MATETEHQPRGHRIEIVPSSASVRVEIDGVVVAETTDASVLHETNLPPRWYIPETDVRMDLLTPTDTRTACPFKGQARYWSANVGGRTVNDVAWSYPTPIPQSQAIAGLLSFYPDKVATFIDGQPLRST
ncbi:MAG TPA: DUF427 domain-containing protein [Acidimicrobiia bacterium]|nr:DUF427 domain-containing protein [Acidimicrobiia bacterium]